MSLFLILNEGERDSPDNKKVTSGKMKACSLNPKV